MLLGTLLFRFIFLGLYLAQGMAGVFNTVSVLKRWRVVIQRYGRGCKSENVQPFMQRGTVSVLDGQD